MKMNTDSALCLLGRYSRWQMINYLCCATSFGVAFAWILMTVVFVGDVPNYRCALPDGATVNESIPLVEEKGQWVLDKCNMYANSSVDNTTVPCQYGYWYDPASGYESTIVSEWDLVCGKEWFVELSMSLQSVGKVIGAIVFNRLSDIYGRKKVFLYCLWANVIIACVRSFSINMVMYTMLVFFGGIIQQGMVCASFILAIELFPTNQRSTAGIVIQFFWALGYMAVSPMAYWLRNWRHLELATALPFILTVPYYWIVSESIPWLVVNGKLKEAERILRKAAKMNKIVLPKGPIFTDATQFSESSSENDSVDPLLIGDDHERYPAEKLAVNGTANGLVCKKEIAFREDLNAADSRTEKENLENSGDISPTLNYAIKDIFKSSKLRCYGFALFVMWLLTCLSYTGINYTVTFLPGNRYLNFFLYALMENPAYAFAWLVAEKGGRRITMMSINVAAGLAMIISTLLPLLDNSANIAPLVITLNMIGKSLITASLAIIYVIVPEIFPTSIRNIGMGLCQSFGRVGTLISPFGRVLYREWDWMPGLIFGAAVTCVGLLALLLPETRFTPLPDSIQEVEAMTRQNVCCITSKSPPKENKAARDLKA